MSEKKMTVPLFIMSGSLVLQVFVASFWASQAYAAVDGMSENNLVMHRRQIFDDLGSALQSGRLEDAKMILAKLRKNAPARAKSALNPIRVEMDSLEKSIHSGDLQSAKDAYLKVQEKMKRLRGGSH